MIALNKSKLSGYKNTLAILIVVVFYSSTSEPLIAQNENLETIVTSFEDYSDQYRETAYCHLNKSTYIKGEMIGFTGYVFDKDLKVPSKLTKNLYCIITDENNKTIKSKLVKTINGFTNNVFNIDSSFTSGHYKFKAYTNWMNNFDERNAFVESFRVIDPEIESTIKKTITKNSIDAQFLPEGGNFVDDVKTNVGVIIKNSKGFGIANTEGIVYDSNNKPVAAFKTNTFGIGRFILYPDINQEYSVKINHLNKTFDFKIDTIKPKGITIHVNNLTSKLAVEFLTNKNTFNSIKGKLLNLIIHNGTDAKGIEVIFNKKERTLIVDNDELFSGINILTLFDENNRPVLERMVFNYNGINILNSGTANHTKFKDSTQISIPFPKIADSLEKNWNISISILPQKTKSYHRHHNIISHTYLQPYINGYIENAQYYFTDIDAKKKYELDNLLITQGWSSYDWNTIFNNNVSDNFVYEEGIILKANQNNKKQKDFVLYPLKYNEGLTVNIPEDENNFVISELYPIDSEKLGVGTLNRKGKVTPPNLNMQFFPSKIPDYNNDFEVLQSSISNTVENLPESQFTISDVKNIQELDEVIIKARAKALRIKKLEDNVFGRVYYFDDAKRRTNYTLVQYINAFVPKYSASESRGTVSIVRRISTSLRNTEQAPLIYFNDILMSNLNFFYGFALNTVDYITVNETGMGEGFQGSNGVIRIYTSLDFINKRQKSPFGQFKFPLTFSEKKKFYVPKYSVYNDTSFGAFGTIDWIPDCKIDNDGNIKFKVYNPGYNAVKLFIEGVTEKGEFISEIKVLNMI